jgi:hypothetical protein
MESKTEFFLKINHFGNDYYSAFTADSFERAHRNCLFACFSEYVEGLKTQCPTAQERFELLNKRYGSRIQETTEELYLLYGDLDEE